VIPRIRHRRFGRADAKLPFASGDRARPLRLVIDSETTPSGEALTCLRRFAHHPDIEVLATGSHAENRLDVGDYDPTHHTVPVRIELSDRVIRSAVYAVDLVRFADELPSASRDEARRGIFLASACEDNDVDGLVTSNPVICGLAPRFLVEHANGISAEEGVALVGLYLRCREDFNVDYGRGFRYSVGRLGFYFALMRELLPSAWRWFSGCVGHSGSSGDDGLLLVAQSAMERVDRALRARDRLHRQLQLPPTNDTGGEALFYFDVALLMLGGAFDATARVVDVVHALGTPTREVGWGRKPWMKKLRRANPNLAQLMSGDASGRVARELVAVLRNTIHGEAIRTISVRSASRHDQLAVVPEGLERRLEHLAEQAGGHGRLGLERLRAGQLFVHPGTYVEAVLPLALAALNEIMEGTPVEQLSGVGPGELMEGPPAGNAADDLFNPAMGRRLRLLAGLA
jgi:hypothetical protein